MTPATETLTPEAAIPAAEEAPAQASVDEKPAAEVKAESASETQTDEKQTDQMKQDPTEEQLLARREEARAVQEARSARLKQFGRKALIFALIALGALLFYVIVNLPAMSSFFGKVIQHTRPVIIGAVIAYLCAPILKFYEHIVFGKIRHEGARKGMSLFLTVITFFVIVALIFVLILPQLIKSITDLVNNYERYLDGLLSFLQGIVDKLPIQADISSTQRIQEQLVDVYGSVDSFVNTEIIPLISDWDFTSAFDNVKSVLTDVFNGIKDVVLGLFIAFYILAAKDRCGAQIRKFRHAVLTEKGNERCKEVIDLVNRCFGGFISGKLLDSLIIGILTFILMAIFRVSPYNVLIATFVGVTNVIPVFGPFIGAIPSFLIVLISNPSKAILFLVLILIIQQLDGNVIGPKILGDQTGVSSLTVIIAITVCGSLWGVVGMLIGVPIFAVIIELVKRELERRLLAKGKETDTVHYYAKNAIADAEKEVHYEHEGLLYWYRHSKLKPAVDKAVGTIRSRFTKSSKKTVPADDTGSAGGGTDTPQQ